MQSLFNASDRDAILGRIDALGPNAVRGWGKMNPAQALCHCATAIEFCTGDRPVKQTLLGKAVAWMVRGSLLRSEKPMGKNAPTDRALVVSDERDFAAEQARLRMLIEKFAERGTAAAGAATHPFFGKLTGDEWGILMFKHIDHHLRQFGG